MCIIDRSLIDTKNFDQVIEFSKQIGKIIVITRGEKGSILINKNEITECKSKKNLMPIQICGTDFLRPISYNERIGSAQVKSCLILAALNTPGETIVNSKKSRNHTEIMLMNCTDNIKVVELDNTPPVP